MIALIHALIGKGYPINLRLAGTGPLLEEVKKQVKHYNLSSVVQFLGPLDHEAIAEEMMHAAIYMQLSSDKVTSVPGGTYIHSECMGRAILEALTTGTFVIAGKNGALREMVTAAQGILVDLDDFQQLIYNVEEILTSSLVRRPMGDTFSWLNIFKGYEALFERGMVKGAGVP